MQHFSGVMRHTSWNCSMISKKTLSFFTGELSALILSNQLAPWIYLKKWSTVLTLAWYHATVSLILSITLASPSHNPLFFLKSQTLTQFSITPASPSYNSPFSLKSQTHTQFSITPASPSHNSPFFLKSQTYTQAALSTTPASPSWTILFPCEQGGKSTSAGHLSVNNTWCTLWSWDWKSALYFWNGSSTSPLQEPITIICMSILPLTIHQLTLANGIGIQIMLFVLY